MPNSKYKNDIGFCCCCFGHYSYLVVALLGEKKKDQIDPPKEVTYTDKNGEDSRLLKKMLKKKKRRNKIRSKEKGSCRRNIKTELYLIDKNGYVVPQTLDLPKTILSPHKHWNI